MLIFLSLCYDYSLYQLAILNVKLIQAMREIEGRYQHFCHGNLAQGTLAKIEVFHLRHRCDRFDVYEEAISKMIDKMKKESWKGMIK
jgi:hypothetical protein